jgi:WD40 repeat protein
VEHALALAASFCSNFSDMYLAGMRHGNGIDIWDYHSKIFISTLKLDCLQGYGSCYSFSSDGRLLAVSTATYKRTFIYDVSNLDNGKRLYELYIPHPVEYASSVCFTRSDEHVIAGFDRKVGLYDATNGAILGILDAHKERIVFIAQVGPLALTASGDGLLIVSSARLAAVARRELKTSIFQVCVAPAEDVVAVCRARCGIVVVSVPSMQTTATVGGTYILILPSSTRQAVEFLLVSVISVMRRKRIFMTCRVGHCF